MTTKQLKNNFDREFDEKFKPNTFNLSSGIYKDFFHSQIDFIIESTKKDMREDIVKKLLKTYKENYAFMSVINDQGDLEDWMIPVSEVLKILEAKNRIKDI